MSTNEEKILSRREIGEARAVKLQKWFEENAGLIRSEFCWPDGTLNQSKIAKAADVPKQTFTGNPAAAALLVKFGKQRVEATPSTASGDDILRKKLSKMTEQVKERELELVRLRREVQVYRQREVARKLMLESGMFVKIPPTPVAHDERKEIGPFSTTPIEVSAQRADEPRN